MSSSKKTLVQAGHSDLNPQEELLRWYAAVGRRLPWRATRNPYRILVSEIMLQQTQVDRVLPFYERFLAQFPDEKTLAAADRETIHRAWKGLGYPSRVERLQAACQQVLTRGSWPDTVEGLRELPGIGPYTAGAVAVFAFGLAVPVVDTNVARVYARRDALPLPLAKEIIWTHAAAEVSANDPIAYTNALMDLGATVCTARQARCTVCPWVARCKSAADTGAQIAASNPLKVASTKVVYQAEVLDRSLPRTHIVLALVHHENRYLIAKRPEKLDQGGNWEIVGGKREAGEDDRTALSRELHEETGLELLAARPLLDWHHVYGNRAFIFHCYRCKVFNPDQAKPLASDGLRWVTPAELVALTFPPANAPLLARLRRYHRIV